jgi:exonuclease 3'-5' domain-containing protein 1
MASKQKAEQDIEQDESIAPTIPKSDVRSNVNTSTESCSKTCDDEKKSEILHERETTEFERETIQNKIISTGQKETSHYGYIDTEGKLSIAIEEIRQAIQKGETIAVDCEGVNLSRFGSVTLVNIAVRGQVYLIDVLKIGSAVYDRGLRSILEDKSIKKLMFDCREDADALKHLYNVRLDGVLDVQLLEVMNRIIHRGYTKIRSLKHCLELFVSDKTMLEVKLKGRSSMDQDNKLWEKRPLSEDILKYASIDVLVLFKLYDALCNRVVDTTRWIAASERYCDKQRSRTDRKYRDGDGLLPPGIF